MPVARLSTQANISVLSDEITRIVMAAILRGLEETVDLGVKHAKRLAPTRKISAIERIAIRRNLSRAEIRSGVRGSRGAAGLRTTVRRSQQYLEAPEVVADQTGVRYRLKNREDESFLTGRGKAELQQRGRTPRTTAIYTVPTARVKKVQYRDSQGRIVTRKSILRGTRSTLGGRLRGEIHRIQVSDGPRFQFDIVSPTEYARFVEFPTSRTTAQPYMRPTLEYLKRPLAEKIKRSLERL
jgi:hypothetical protein